MPESVDFVLRLLLFAGLHSLFAAPGIKAYLQQLSGSSLPWYRLIYNLSSLILFVWVMLAWQSTRVIYLAPGVWSLVMYGLQLLLLAGIFLCLRQTGLGGFLGINASEQAEEQLNTSGCYAIVRHPLYLLSLLFFVLNPVMTTRWLTLTAIGTTYLVIGAIVEERRMLQRFGTAYSRYQQRVPFLIPRLGFSSIRHRKNHRQDTPD